MAELPQRKMVDITRDKPIKVTIRVVVPVRDHPKVRNVLLYHIPSDLFAYFTSIYLGLLRVSYTLVRSRVGVVTFCTLRRTTNKRATHVPLSHCKIRLRSNLT